ncbi:aminoglycoside phosphotransferase family protein [Planomicrobium sp. CPCC 101079]|uniref:aminoglycoside phosphotransferase family protein n=1 Tax=Planomicrobium sp. CPCC 101079 TaxID=2599618 RepID=UPI00164636E3|nr:aminoglycoside phosphotransferase family protein [Planomicrobium sp. CPCC 101079]
MDISKVMKELEDKKLILGDNQKCKPLTGGTVSEIYLLSIENGSDFVIKSNKPDIVKSEAEFLDLYRDIPLLPELIYTDPTNKYIIYTYIPGATVNVSTPNKKEILQAMVVDLLNNYKTVSSTEGWGWRDSPINSWGNFLLTEVRRSSEVLTDHLLKVDVELVMALTMRAGRYESLGDPFLIHGDCGIHNFIMEDGRLSGVIDPAPVYGPPLYDLIYAFCSSPADLTKETLDSAASLLVVQPIDKKWLYEEVAIVLYLRLATCLKHHPADFASYLAAWNYWKNIINPHFRNQFY